MDRFAYRPTLKTLPDFPDHKGERLFEKVQVAFIQAEAQDQEQEQARVIEKKILKNLRKARLI